MFGVHDELAKENAQLKSINEDLKATIKSLQEHLEMVQNDRDSVRVYRWHATYNAALQGLYASTVHRPPSFVEDAHGTALLAADQAHGELE